MTPLQTVWYWKKFYWKVFVTLLVTGGGAVITGLAGVDWTQLTRTQKVLFVTGVLVVVGKSLDSLVDQTFQQLASGQSNGNGHANGNGNGAPSPTNQPIVQVQQQQQQQQQPIEQAK